MVQHVRAHRRNGRPVRAYQRRSPTAAAGGGGIVVVVLLGFFWLIGRGTSAPESDPAAGRTWTAGGTTFTRASTDDNPLCSAHAYGKVQTFLAEHPCTGLDRALYETSDESGNRTLVTVSWVDMPTTEQAGQLRELADRTGSGNITELSKTSLLYSGTPITGRHYNSALEKHTVIIAQAEPLSGNTTGEQADQLATVALAAPRP